jgi:hypothetical protein
MFDTFSSQILQELLTYLLAYLLTYYLLNYLLTYLLITYLLNLLTYLLTYLLHGAGFLLEKLTGLQLVRNSPRFMEPEGSSPHSQARATYPYPEPAQSSPHTHIPNTRTAQGTTHV